MTCFMKRLASNLPGSDELAIYTERWLTGEFSDSF